MDSNIDLDVVDHASLLESIPVASLITDPTGTVLYANNRLTELFGYTNGDAIGLSLGDLIDAPIRSRWSIGTPDYGLDLVIGHRKGGGNSLVEVGSGRWATAMGPLLVYSLVDLTGRVEAEQARREAEQRLRDIVNNTTAVIYAKDVDGRYLMINRQYEKLFGVSPDEVAGKTDFDLFPHAMAEAFRRNDRAVVTTGNPLEIEEAVPHTDGTHTYISVKFPLRDHRDRVCGMAGISTDITDRLERLRVEQELRAAREIQRLLYPAAPPAVPGFDLAGVVYPAHVMCGDYFDYIPRPDGTVLCVVADVTGHGIGPALEMVETRALLRAMLHTESDPGVVMARVNLALAADLPPDNFVSMFLAEIDTVRRTVRYCGAGHEGLLVRAAGDEVRLESTDLLLGVLPDGPFQFTNPIRLDMGDVLVLTTDGVTETMSPGGAAFGWDGLVRAVRRVADRPAREIVAAVYEATREFADGPHQTDDVTVLAVKAI